MHIEPFFDERTATLTYVVHDEQTRDAVVIDPVLDFDLSSGKVWTDSVDKISAHAKAHGLKVLAVLETHVHADHLSGSQWLKERFGAKVAVGARITEVQAVFKGVFALDSLPADGSQFDLLLKDFETYAFGSLSFRVLPTPGHTPACVSYLVGDAVFTGDALFLDDIGVGRCDFPKGDAGTLYDAVTRSIFSLPDATRIFTGHDYPPAGRTWQASTTVGSAKKANVQLRADMTRAEFVDKRTARDRTLSVPKLLYPSIQVNIAGGRLPAPNAAGQRFLKLPLTGP